VYNPLLGDRRVSRAQAVLAASFKKWQYGLEIRHVE